MTQPLARGTTEWWDAQTITVRRQIAAIDDEIRVLGTDRAHSALAHRNALYARLAVLRAKRDAALSRRNP